MNTKSKNPEATNATTVPPTRKFARSLAGLFALSAMALLATNVVAGESTSVRGLLAGQNALQQGSSPGQFAPSQGKLLPAAVTKALVQQQANFIAANGQNAADDNIHLAQSGRFRRWAMRPYSRGYYYGYNTYPYSTYYYPQYVPYTYPSNPTTYGYPYYNFYYGVPYYPGYPGFFNPW